MSTLCLDLSFAGSLKCYPKGCVADAIEDQIALTLPLVEGLVPGLTQEQRLTVLGTLVTSQRAAFMELYGEPFGCERRSEPRSSSMDAGSVTTVVAGLSIQSA